jgi:ACS family tartrate transporter-like MFS transporter
MPIATRVQRLLMWRIVSITFLLYFFFAIDRGNVGLAALEMNRALGLSAEIFGFGSGLFTVAYLLFQVPNAELLRRLGARRGFALIACSWGIVSTSTAFVPDAFWFVVNRFLLGLSEAGFHAFLIYYINQLCPRQVRGTAISLTFIAVPVSMIVASPLSGWLLGVAVGPFDGWQSLFILEGLPSILLGLLCLQLVPDNPGQMRFLSADERAWLSDQLAAESNRKATNEAGSLGNFRAALGNPLVWGLGFVLFTSVFAINVMLIWMPQIIRQVSGAGNLTVGWLNSLPWLAFIVGCLLAGRQADQQRSALTLLRASVALATLGFLIAAALQDSRLVSAFCGFLLAGVGIGATQALFWILTMQLLGGAGAAASFAVITVLGNGSGVFAHPVIGRMHDASGSFGPVIWALAAFFLAALGTLHWVAGRRGSHG